jgi:Ca2+-binding RTX toxin-like protein
MATIIGTQQNDNLIGTQDNDTIIGLAGHDVSTGGDGGDRFVYQRLSDLSVWTGSVLPWRESITDFGDTGSVTEPDEDEVLDLSALDDFLFIGDEAFTATGRSEYRFFREFGSEGQGVVLLFDKDGDGGADRYLVLEDLAGGGRFDAPDEHPIFTNLLDPADFTYHYEVGTDAADNLIGTADEDRMYGFAGDDRMHGKAGDDVMFGGAGNDRLDGGDGIDTYIGGPGNDVYIVDTTEFEDVLEEAGEGIDLVVVTDTFEVSFNPLGANIENLTLAGAAYQGEGNDLANIITGNGVINRLGGGAGNDSISGAGGADSIRAGTGHDWIRGGAGDDFLFGNSGADKFVYYSVDEIGGASDEPGDLINDFEGINAGATERDRIDLHRIDADTSTAADNAFHFIGSDEFTGTAGELRDVIGTVTVDDPDPFVFDEPFQSTARLVEGDVDGDGTADFQLAVVLPQGTTPMNAGDFYL